MPVDRRTRPSRRSLAALVADTTLGRLSAAVLIWMRHRPVPLHWTGLFGVATAAIATVYLSTGFVMGFLFDASTEEVVYHGSYAPLDGHLVSAAYASELRLAFDVHGGMLLRQLHHWSMQLLPATIIMQMLVTFFTGGFRKPRRTRWVLLFLLHVVALAGGWSGYGLPDDMLSGSGLRIVEGVALGIPLIGTDIAGLLFGGPFPGRIIETLAVIHFGLVPIAMALLLTLQAVVALAESSAQFPAPGRSEASTTGVALWPSGLIRLGGFFTTVVGILVVIATTVTINPVWQYGPSDPGNATAGSQPDWYTAFLDGALRLVPPGWEIIILGRTVTLAVIVPLLAIGAFMVLVLLYPFLEQWIAADGRDHHLLQRPRDTPTRTAIGAAGMTFYGILWAAGSADVFAHQFQLALETVIHTEQTLLTAGPLIAFALARRTALALQRKDREAFLHGYETGRIVRLPDGDHIEVHAPISAEERWRILAAERPEPVILQPKGDGRITTAMRIRTQLNHFFFTDRLVPLPPTKAKHAAPVAAGDATQAPVVEA
jgi:ubiquinol-cytochrome c reductase cytochrome b subunit